MVRPDVIHDLLAGQVTVMICPFCRDWQLDYDHGVMSTFVRWKTKQILTPGGHLCGIEGEQFEIDLKPWYAALEAVAGEHLLPCALMHHEEEPDGD